jgi:hypothetical protein
LFRFLPLRALIFFDLGAALEVAANQTLEFADEVFCAAKVPALQRVLSAGSTQLASSELLRRTRWHFAASNGFDSAIQSHLEHYAPPLWFFA